jgi:hypothetical protein
MSSPDPIGGDTAPPNPPAPSSGGGKGVVGCAWIAVASVICLFVAMTGLCAGGGTRSDGATSLLLVLLGVGGLLAVLAALVGLALLIMALVNAARR